jgi:hypothetical protein
MEARLTDEEVRETVAAMRMPDGDKEILLRRALAVREKRARVTFDRERVSVEQMIDTVERVGFHASLTATEPIR